MTSTLKLNPKSVLTGFVAFGALAIGVQGEHRAYGSTVAASLASPTESTPSDDAHASTDEVGYWCSSAQVQYSWNCTSKATLQSWPDSYCKQHVYPWSHGAYITYLKDGCSGTKYGGVRFKCCT